MFFQSVKKKIATKNILWSLLSVLLCVGAVALTISNGFSSETGWQVGPRGTNVGIPIPNWAVSCLYLILTAVFAYLFVYCMKDVITAGTYNKLLDAARAIGDVEQIDRLLTQTPKSDLAKGELRYNSTVLFYSKGTEVTLLAPKDIVTIQPIKREGKQTEYFVEITAKDGTILRIDTREKNLLCLANDILACKDAAQ